MSGANKPTCKALLLCDNTIQEHGSGKISLIGIFDSFFVDQNLITRPCEAFCQLTNAMGEYEISVQIRSLSNDEIVVQTSPSKIQIPDRLMIANVIIPLPPFQFQQIGAYDFIILADNEEIDRQRFSVINQQQ